MRACCSVEMSARCRITVAVIALCALLAAAQAGACRLPPFALTYALERGGITVGEVVIRFRYEGQERYVYRSNTRTTGLAALFAGQRIEQRSEGVWTAAGPRPVRHEQERERGGEVARHRLDLGPVPRYQGDAGQWLLAVPDGVYDPPGLLLELIRAERCGGLQGSYPMVTETGLLRRFRVERGEPVALEALGETWQTIPLAREEVNGPFRMTLYLAPEFEHLPLRIDWSDGEREYRLQLRSAEQG